jgi:PKD repeat protein
MKKLVLIVVLFGTGILFHSCSDDDYPVPPASTVSKFTYTIDNDELAPATVTFTNTSIVPSNVGDATYYWNFGDTQSSLEENPSHLYTEPGVYNVNLVVTTSVSLEVKQSTQTIVIKDPNATGTPIYYTDGSQVFQGLINGESPIFSTVNNIVAQSSYGMAIDTLNQKLYISDYGADKIYRSNLDGSNFENFRTGVDSPNGMAIDYENNKIYWDTSSGIQRGSLDGTDVEDFVTGQPNDPDGVSIDFVNNKLYWINYNGGVWVKNLDGTGETELLPTVEGGSILVIGDRIYYDEYIGSGDIRLKSANLDGTNVTTIAVGIGRVVYGLAYDGNAQKIYWGDRSTDIMWRANLDGSNPQAWYTAAADTRGIVIGTEL